MHETRTKREIARDLLTEMFANSKRVPIAEAKRIGLEHDVSLTTLRRACRDLGVHEIHNGPHPAFWER